MKLFHLKKCNVTISFIMFDIDNLISSFVCKSFDGVASSKTAKRQEFQSILISRVCSLFAIKIKSKGIQWIRSRECDTIDDI